MIMVNRMCLENRPTGNHCAIKLMSKFKMSGNKRNLMYSLKACHKLGFETSSMNLETSCSR